MAISIAYTHAHTTKKQYSIGRVCYCISREHIRCLPPPPPRWQLSILLDYENTSHSHTQKKHNIYNTVLSGFSGLSIGAADAASGVFGSVPCETCTASYAQLRGAGSTLSASSACLLLCQFSDTVTKTKNSVFSSTKAERTTYYCDRDCCRGRAHGGERAHAITLITVIKRGFSSH